MIRVLTLGRALTKQLEGEGRKGSCVSSALPCVSLAISLLATVAGGHQNYSNNSTKLYQLVNRDRYFPHSSRGIFFFSPAAAFAPAS